MVKERNMKSNKWEWIRHKFYLWIKHLLGVREGCELTRLALIVKCILFPSIIVTVLANSDLSFFKYDGMRDVLIIEGVKYSHELFRAWSKQGIPDGSIFKLKRGNLIDSDIITIEMVIPRGRP
jgi:hypothetical protein